MDEHLDNYIRIISSQYTTNIFLKIESLNIYLLSAYIFEILYSTFSKFHSLNNI